MTPQLQKKIDFALNKTAQKVPFNPNQTTADPEPANPGGGNPNNEEIG